VQVEAEFNANLVRRPSEGTQLGHHRFDGRLDASDRVLKGLLSVFDNAVCPQPSRHRAGQAIGHLD
jgi:hypothetical protein